MTHPMRKVAVAIAFTGCLSAYACAPAAPPVTAPAASASASASACDPKPTPPIADADPKVVRCGIDDRPRSIVSELDVPPASRAKKMEAPAFGRGGFGRGFVPPAAQGGLPRAGVKLGAPQGKAADLGAIAKAFEKSELDFDACDTLAVPTDEGKFELELSLQAGAPSVVKASKVKAPTPFFRCVMERVCGLKDAPSVSAEVSLPVAVTWNYAKLKGPVEKAPTSGVVPFLLLENPKGDTTQHAFFRTSRILVRGALRMCVGQGPNLRIELELGDKNVVTKASVLAMGPGLDRGPLDCVEERLRGEKLPDPPDGFFTGAERSLAFMIDFTPPAAPGTE